VQWGSRRLGNRGAFSMLSAIRAAALNSGLASTPPSSAKLTRPVPKAASQSAERSKPLCTSRRCASSHSAHAWREPEGRYADEPGFCKSAATDEIAAQGYVLTPGPYVGTAAAEEEGEPFDEKIGRLVALLHQQQAEGARLDAEIGAKLKEFGLV
jgi:N-6 DNA Methylase